MKSTVTFRQVDGDYVARTTTSEDGGFEIDALPNGRYLIEVRPSDGGFLAMTIGPAMYEFPAPIGFNLVMVVDTHQIIALTVTSKEAPKMITVAGELPLGSSSEAFSLCFNSTVHTQCTTSNRFGQYFLVLPLGKYGLVVTRGSAEVLSKDVVLSADGATVPVVERSELLDRP